MKVGMYYSNTDVRMEDQPTPQIREKELLLKTMASGICGSDILEWYRIKTAPKVLGHEVAGEVVDVGSGVTQFQKGDRVFTTHHVSCMECHYCRNNHHTSCETLHTTTFYPGGFSQYIRIPAINVKHGTLKLPDSLTYEEATFIEPLGCVVRAQRLMGIKKGDTVLVLGCGPSGMLHIKLAFSKGARVCATNRGAFRRGLAEQLGAHVIDGNDDVPARVQELLGKKADQVIDCAGSETTGQQALDSTDRGGKIMFFAVPSPEHQLPVPLNEFWRNEMSIMTSYAASFDDLKESLRLLESGTIQVKDLISHRLPLEKIGEGFRLTAEGKDCLKVIIAPHSI